MSEIAEFALLPPPSLTRLIDRMVADNLVYRRADPQDGRRVLVRVTQRGRETYLRLAELVGREQDRMLGGADPQDLVQLAEILARVLPPPA